MSRSPSLAHEDSASRKDRLNAVLEEIDAVRSASSTRGSVDVTLLELLVEWEILGEEAGLHEMIMWANAFLFNRLLRLSVAENSLIVVLN